jgi:CRISP-associated protein Cas1
VLLRRNGRPAPKGALAAMRDARDLAGEAADLGQLLGAEGLAARHYFGAFDSMVRSELKPAFSMRGRNRRPPRDPINALLSFAYACLTREVTQVLRRVGFDAERGFLHQPRHGRPALALDLMEEFRPVLADSVVLNAINNGVVQQDGFDVHPTGVAMTDAARRGFIRAWERRLDELATHPLTGTRLSMRRMLELHARLWARHIHGELPEPPTYPIR